MSSCVREAVSLVLAVTMYGISVERRKQNRSGRTRGAAEL
jgi:hypothetical protein